MTMEMLWLPQRFHSHATMWHTILFEQVDPTVKYCIKQIVTH